MIKSHTLENQFLKIKTINIGASLYEVIDKRKKINLILNIKISLELNTAIEFGAICAANFFRFFMNSCASICRYFI